MKWCRGCAIKRAILHPAHSSCKRVRLCTTIDCDLARLAHETCDKSSRTLEHFTRLTQAVENGYVGAETYARYNPYPTDTAAFLTLLLTLHRLVFADTGMTFAGRFRQPGEKVFFGHGRNELPGAPPHLVIPRLQLLHQSVFKPSLAELDRARFAHQCAIFLERFFLIHPFRDGNGRIGRLIIRIAARSTGTFRFAPFGSRRMHRRDYVQALEYAHRYAPGAEAHRGGIDPYCHLSAWLDQYLVETTVLDESLDFPPPNGDGDADL